jgi:hypothetical protein
MAAVSVWPTTAEPVIVGAGEEVKLSNGAAGPAMCRRDVASLGIPDLMAPLFADLRMLSKFAVRGVPDDKSLATAPATCGAAIEVPSNVENAELLVMPAEVILEPGA